MSTPSAESSTASKAAEVRGFPDPSISLVEFSGEGLGILLAGQTERDAANRRIVLRKVAYVRLEQKAWGFAAFAEVWIQQDASGLFMAVDAKSGKIFQHPSRRRYEVAFLSKDIFDCSILCLKDREPGPLFELIAVSFAGKAGFSVESGFLVAPDDYAAENNYGSGDIWVPVPPHAEAKAG